MVTNHLAYTYNTLWLVNMDMKYRCVAGVATNHTFTALEYVRYQHNLNMLHWRTHKSSQITLHPIDVTEDSDEEDGYLMGFFVGCSEEVSKEYIRDLSERAASLNRWLVADITNDVYYKDVYIPSQWIQRIASHVLTNDKTIEDLYILQDDSATSDSAWLTSRDSEVASAREIDNSMAWYLLTEFNLNKPYYKM